MIRLRASWKFLGSGRAVQLVWFLFLVTNLSLMMPGLIPYRQTVQTPCDVGPCLMGQINSQEAAEAAMKGAQLAEYGAIIFIIYLFSAAFLMVISLLLIWRKPGHPAAVSGSFLFVAAAAIPFVQASAAAGIIPAAAGKIMHFIQFALLLPTIALLPDGRFRPTWMRWPALASIPVLGLVTFGWFGPVGSAGVGFLLSILVVGGALYRPLIKKQRQEAITWTLVAVALLAVAQVIGQPVQWLPLPGIALGYIQGISVSPYPVYGMLLLVGGLTCLTIALLGDELFRVDVALNRAIVYSFLSLFVISLYVLIVGYLSSIFQSGGNLWFSLVATGVVAALFQPIREWVQRFVNRMIYGEREDPYTAIARLVHNLETVIAPDQVIPTILRTVREALKVTYTAIRLSPSEGDGHALTIEDGKRSPVILSLPLVAQNEVVGYLDLSSRQGENKFSAADRLLLEGLARQAGTAIHAARLNADLQRARERLVLAQEEERRRIRRDLHDGLGASLAALSLQAGEVQRLLLQDSETAARRLAELRAGLRAAVGDTRRLVYGLRPPALDELGLLEALRARVAQYQGVAPARSDGAPAGEAVQMNLNLPATLPELPAAVEVAIYRIVEEALTNIVHHAQAKNGFVEMSIKQQSVCVEIRDDGMGLPEHYRNGIGLNSMRERASELGGTWSIQSALGQGTCVTVVLPVSSPSGKDNMSRTTILIADDHPMFRKGMRSLLESLPDFEVSGEAESGQTAVQMAEELQPDVILMDLQMPGISTPGGGGLEAIRTITSQSPNIRILVVTLSEDDDSVFAALRAGARGYLLKDADEDEMVRAIRSVTNNEAIFSPSIANRVLSYFAGQPMLPRTLFPGLTDREREILKLVAQGDSNAQIATKLFLSQKTVSNYVSNIFSKLQVADRAQAIIKAREAGIE